MGNKLNKKGNIDNIYLFRNWDLFVGDKDTISVD